MVRTRLLERGDGRPVGGAGVELGGGAAVEGDRGAAGVLGDAAGVEEGGQRVVDADAELHRHRHRAGVVDRRAEQRREQPGPGGQGGAAAVAGDLAHRAAQVEVDVVDVALGR